MFLKYNKSIESNKIYKVKKPIQNLGDLVAINKNQQGPGLKLKYKFLRPYRMTKIKLNGN